MVPARNIPLHEDDLIQRLARRFPHRPDLEKLAIGDDTAWLTQPWDLVTADLMTEGVHFDRAFAPLDAIAWRALAANLSDIAAMGGTPGPFLLGLGVPPSGLDRDQADALAAGFADCLAAHGPAAAQCWLVGGDVVRSPGGLLLAITLHGRAPARGPLRRANARAGDRIVVFSPLGDGAAGLALLQAGLPHEPADAALIDAHLRPRAQLALAAELAACPVRLCALDLSDGLWRDAARFRTADGRPLGARIQADAVPRSPALDDAARRLGRAPWELAVGGGEDYKLCAVCAAQDVVRLPGEPVEIGELTDDPSAEVTLWHGATQLPAPRGFEHFPRGTPDGDQP